MMIDALPKNLEELASAGASQVLTTTLLPSGALTSVTVRPRGDGAFQVSDEGAGWKDLLALGFGELTGGDRKRGDLIAERLGLAFDGRAFHIQEVTADQLPGAIVFVAEAAREWSAAAADKAARRSETALVRRVEDKIRALFPSAKIAREAEVAGASTKRHRFDLVLDLPGERKALFEAVSPNPKSLSAAHLKLFDIKEAHPEWLREAVTERLADWGSADMALLAKVATHVRAMDREWRDLGALLH